MTEIAFIEAELRAVSEYVRDRYNARHEVHISHKIDPNDMLTEVDLAVQERIVARIRDEYPDDIIVGEESGLHELPHQNAGRVWLIDPIDGTQNFVRSLFPAFGVSIAFCQDGEVAAGGVLVPMQETLFLAERGAGATRNGQRLHVSNVTDLTMARAEIDFSVQRDRAATVDTFRPLMEQVGQVRCYCAAVIGICSIATGDSDIYVHVGLNPWDFAAAMLIAEEAGGSSSKLDGSSVQTLSGRQGIAITNGHVHSQLLGLIP
ncbi:MAG: inositol monophosphatase [Candidatus Hydrogenedentota bacterium]